MRVVHSLAGYDIQDDVLMLGRTWCKSHFRSRDHGGQGIHCAKQYGRQHRKSIGRKEDYLIQRHSQNVYLRTPFRFREPNGSCLRSLWVILDTLKQRLLLECQSASTRLLEWKRMGNSHLTWPQRLSTFLAQNLVLRILYQKWTWLPSLISPLEQWRFIPVAKRSMAERVELGTCDLPYRRPTV